MDCIIRIREHTPGKSKNPRNGALDGRDVQTEMSFVQHYLQYSLVAVLGEMVGDASGLVESELENRHR